MNINYPLILHGEENTYYVSNKDIYNYPKKQIKQLKFGYINNNKSKIVAVKIIAKEFTDANYLIGKDKNKEFLELFENDYILKFFDYFEINDYLFFILEYCNQGSLREYLENYDGSISIKESIQMFEIISDAFNDIHSKGFVHRNITPNEILISNSLIKIAGFESSRFMDENKNYSNLTQFSIDENYKYKSFEILQKIQYTSKCDVFSVGVLIYSMINKGNPFINSFYKDDPYEDLDDDKYLEILEENEGKEIIFPNLNDNEDKNLISLLKKMLAVREKDRCNWNEVFKFFQGENDIEFKTRKLRNEFEKEEFAESVFESKIPNKNSENELKAIEEIDLTISIINAEVNDNNFKGLLKFTLKKNCHLFII